MSSWSGTFRCEICPRTTSSVAAAGCAFTPGSDRRGRRLPQRLVRHSLIQFELARYFHRLARPDQPASPGYAIANARLQFRASVQVQDAGLPHRVRGAENAVVKEQPCSPEKGVVDKYVFRRSCTPHLV